MNELVFWHGMESSENLEVLRDKIAEFNQAYPQIKVHLESYGRQDLAEEDITKSISSMRQDSPAMMWYGPQLGSRLAEKEVLAPVSDFLGEEKEFIMDNIFDCILDYATYQGDLITVPFDANNLGVVYNKDYFKQAGIESLPDTWEEFIEVAQKVQQESNARYAFLLPYGQEEWTVWVWETFLRQAGGQILINNKKLDFPSQPAVKALRLWSDLKDKYQVADLSLPEAGANPQRLIEGRVAMQIVGSWIIPELEAADVNYGTFMLPKNERRATGLGGENLYIFRTNSEEEKVAWKFSKYFLQDEVQIDFAVQTGYLPVTKSALNSPRYQMFLSENPAFEPFAEQIEHGFIRPTCPEYSASISPALGKAIKRVLDRAASPEQALKDAADQIKSNTRLR